MKIRLAEENDQLRWDDYVCNHPAGLAYHLYAWQRAVKEGYGFDSHCLLAEQDDRICGVLPLVMFRVPFASPRYVSLPYCDVGGILADSTDIQTEMKLSAIAMAQKNGFSGIDIRTVAEQDEVQVNPLEFHKVRMLLELPGNAEVLMAGLKAKVRSQVKKPVRDGLSARLGGLELLDEFYSVFAANMRELGSPVHSRKWIEAVVRNFGNRARIGVTYLPDGVPAAAGIILIHPTTVSIPWASSLRKYNSFNPNMLLYWTFLAFSAEEGYRFFDFGRSTPDEGTFRFKQQWGANPEPLVWKDLLAQETASSSARPASASRRAAEVLWSRLPFGVTTFVGPMLRRNISL